MKARPTRRAVLFALALAAALPLTAPAGAGEINETRWSGLAIEGTDPVAYFTEGKAVEGSKKLTVYWKEATWLFASAENKAKFEAEPEKYAPQFGGYCAWAMSQGYTASIDPEAWKIVDGKLYLNYSKSVQQQWAGDIPGNIAKGEANWPGLRKDLIN